MQGSDWNVQIIIIITRLKVTFKEKVKKFKFSSIMLFTDLKTKASTGKLILLPPSSRKG